MKLRLSWLAGLFISFAGLAIFFHQSRLEAINHNSIDSNSAPKRSTSSDNSSHSTPMFDTTPQTSTKETGGLVTADFILAEITAMAGESEPVRWRPDTIRNKYQLTTVAAHLHNLETNFELLYVNKIQHEADSDETLDEITYYTGSISEADERVAGASLILSKYVEANKSKVQFDENTRTQYFFVLKPNDLQTSFSRRAPEGTSRQSEPNAGAFDPLSILTDENGNFDETAEYQYTKDIGGNRYSITVTPRILKLSNIKSKKNERLTIEVEVREVDSNTTNSFILVYKQI